MYGKDIVKLGEYIPTKTRCQIQKQYGKVKAKLQKNIDFENADLFEILDSNPTKYWTEQEMHLLEKTVKSHGVHYDRIFETLKTKSRA